VRFAAEDQDVQERANVTELILNEPVVEADGFYGIAANGRLRDIDSTRELTATRRGAV